MPTLQFKGFPQRDYYNGPLTGFIKAGDKVEVDAEGAAYLVESFGDAFEPVGSAVSKPKKSRSRKRSAPTTEDADAKRIKAVESPASMEA